MPCSESCWELALFQNPPASNVKGLQRIEAAPAGGSFTHLQRT